MSRVKAAFLAMLAAASVGPVTAGVQDSRRTAELAAMGRPDLAMTGAVLLNAHDDEYRNPGKSNRISQAKRRKLRRRTNGRSGW